MNSDALQFAHVAQQLVVYAGSVTISVFLGLTVFAWFRRAGSEVAR